MKLYVANVTRQLKCFCYRLDYNDHGQRNPGLNALLKRQEIGSGKQEPIGGDLHHQQVMEIVPQLLKVGALSVQTALANQQRAVADYIYSEGIPVTAEAIRRVHAYNTGLKIEEGRKRREAAAIGANRALEALLEQAPPELKIEVPEEVTVEFEQLEVSEADEKAVAEGYRVRADAGPPSPSRPPIAARAPRKKAA